MGRWAALLGFVAGCGSPLAWFEPTQLAFRVVGDQAELSLGGAGCTLGEGVSATLNGGPMRLVTLGEEQADGVGCLRTPTFSAPLPPPPGELRFVVADGEQTFELVASHPQVAPTLAFAEPARSATGDVVLKPADPFVLEASAPLVSEVSFTLARPAKVCASGNFLMRTKGQRTLQGWLPREGLCPGEWEVRTNFPPEVCVCPVDVCDCPTRYATARFVLQEPPVTAP